jgi:tRNA U34 5-methylaminomethyl-2-thiouridine-forming methyltransferase MnmC
MELVITNDGSHTLRVPDLQEHYHSTFGAITESLHVFIEAGLKMFSSKPQIVIFEIGFGTGLNALLSCLYALENNIEIFYYAIEINPISIKVADSLNYPGLINDKVSTKHLFHALHEAPWDQVVNLAEHIHLHKIHTDFTVFSPDFKCDLIYFDAFGPEKQPEMWTLDIFKNLYHCLNPGGIITTYCVKGDIKRRLKLAGFRIEKLPGPPGKREMLRGKVSGKV